MSVVDQGKVGEYQFATELLKRGYVPLWPSAESVPYDMVFLNDSGQALRVQVKSSNQKKRIDLDVATRVHGRRIQYTKAHIDLLVVWAMAADTWYLIPVESATKSMSLSPSSTRCKWREFKEAWHLLR